MKEILFIGLFVGLIQVICGLVFIKNKSKSFQSYLIYVFLLSFISLVFLLNTLKINSENQIVNFISLMYFVACLLLSPMFYLYIKTLRYDFTEGTLSLMQIQKHFTPAAILFIINVFSFVYFLLSKKEHFAGDYVENIMTYSNVIGLYFVFLIQVVFYVINSIKEYYSYRSEILNYYSFDEGLKMHWLKIYLLGFILFIAAIYFLQSFNFDKRVFGILIIGYLMVSGYSAFQQEIFLKRIKSIQVNKSSTINYSPEIHLEPLIDEEIHSVNANTKTEALDEAYMDELYEKILQSIEKDKIFLDPNLSLVLFAKMLGTNTKYLSTTINTKFHKNFSNFINTYRVAESIRLLSSSKINTHTLESIALESGFKSRSVFITAFKKETNLTPSQFRKGMNLET